MTEEIEKRSSADTVYYGKTFRNYGREWTLIGLRDYVPLNVIVHVITKTVPHNPLKKNYTSLSKDKIVDIMMRIYDKADNDNKQKIEKWVYAHRFRRKVQTDSPILRRLESFYMFLRGKDNPYYIINISPDVATKVAAQITLSGIQDILEVKSILKSTICKKRQDWEAFDSLFNTWFESTAKSYGFTSRTTIKPTASHYLHMEITPSLSLEEALKKLRTVLTDNPNFGGTTEVNSEGGEDDEDIDDSSSSEESGGDDSGSGGGGSSDDSSDDSSGDSGEDSGDSSDSGDDSDNDGDDSGDEPKEPKEPKEPDEEEKEPDEREEPDEEEEESDSKDDDDKEEEEEEEDDDDSDDSGDSGVGGSSF